MIVTESVARKMPKPELIFTNRQRKIACDMRWLRNMAALALTHCLSQKPRLGAVLSELPEVSISLVSDAVIARVHVDFMDIPGATDVITFQHGEIIISAETAAANAAIYGRDVNEEIALYVVHGMLHLHGYLDKAPKDFERMKSTQEAVLKRCLAEAAPR